MKAVVMDTNVVFKVTKAVVTDSKATTWTDGRIEIQNRNMIEKENFQTSKLWLKAISEKKAKS